MRSDEDTTLTIPRDPQQSSCTSVRPSSWEVLGLVVAITLFMAVCLLLIYQGVPLGHDEAVYSTRARELVNGERASAWWAPYRAPGLSSILMLAWIGNGTEPYLRVIVALSGSALIVFSWLLGRLTVGPGGALVAALGIALTPVILMSATQVWPDVPGAAAVMATLFTYSYALTAPRFRWWMVVVVILLVGIATAIRFGAPIPLGIGLIGLTMWRWPSERERKLRVSATAAGVIALVALILTQPLAGASSPLEAISQQSASIPLLQGFRDYWSVRGQLFAGSAAVALVGVVAGVFGSSLDRNFRKVFIWPLMIGLVTFVALSASVHGETRYLAPVYPWFWLSGGAGLVALSRRMPRVLATVSAVAAVIVFTALAPTLSDNQNRFNEGFATIRRAARSLATGVECGVFTSYTPQVGWYSGCKTVGINRTEVVLDSPFLPDGPQYLFIVERGKRQPDSELLEEYVKATTGVATTFGKPGRPRGYIEIWPLEDP
jgi:hypothetical protein